MEKLGDPGNLYLADDWRILPAYLWRTFGSYDYGNYFYVPIDQGPYSAKDFHLIEMVQQSFELFRLSLLREKLVQYIVC